MDELQQYVGIAPAWFAVAPLIGAALLVGCCYLVVRRHVTDSWKVVGREVSWSVPALLVLLLLALVCLFGLYVSNGDYLVGATALVTVSGCAPLFRGSLDVALERLPKWAEVVLGFVRDVIIICASIFLSFVVLELPWNPDFLSIEPKFILVNLVLVGTPIMAVYLIGGAKGRSVGGASCRVLHPWHRAILLVHIQELCHTSERRVCPADGPLRERRVQL